MIDRLNSFKTSLFSACLNPNFSDSCDFHSEINSIKVQTHPNNSSFTNISE